LISALSQANPTAANLQHPRQQTEAVASSDEHSIQITKTISNRQLHGLESLSLRWPATLLLTEVSADHRLAVLVNARGEALQGHADSVAFRVPQVVVIDTIPLLHHPSTPAQKDKRRWALLQWS